MKGEATGKAESILRVLSNPVNLRIAVLLSRNPYTTGELARLIGKSEADISRRLSLFRKLGLVESRWVRSGGKNIKLYVMRSGHFSLDLSEGRILLGEKERENLLLEHADAWKHPEPEIFVGRVEELSMLSHLGPGMTMVVSGLPGIGKTSLVAKHLEISGAKGVFWHTITEADLLETILKKIALYLSASEDRRLQGYLKAGLHDMYGALRILVDSLDKLEATVVFDDYHRIRDGRIAELIEYISKNIRRARLIVITRRTPSPPRLGLRTEYVVLGGLKPKETEELLVEVLGRRPSKKVLAELNAALRGYTVLVKWFADISSKRGLGEALKLLYQGKVMERFWETLYEELNPAERKILGSLVCTGGALEKEFMDKLVGTDTGRRALSILSDKNYVFITGEKVILNELVQTLSSKKGGLYCEQLQKKYIDYLLGKEKPRLFLEAFKIATENGFWDIIARLVEYRVSRIRYRILDYMEPYDELLERAVRMSGDAYIKALLISERAMIRLSKGELQEAYNMLRHVLPLLEDRAPPVIISLVYSRLIQIDSSRAEAYYEKAVEQARLIENHSLRYIVLSHIHSNMALHYVRQKNLAKALEHGWKNFQNASRSGDPVEYVYSEFQWIILDSVDKDTLDTGRLGMLRGMADALGIPLHYYDYIVFFEVLGHILESRWDRARRLILEYKRKVERTGIKELPCNIYSLALLITNLRGRRTPYRKYLEKCMARSEKECEFSVIAGLLGYLENWEKGLENCSWFDQKYLEKLLLHVSPELWKRLVEGTEKKNQR